MNCIFVSDLHGNQERYKILFKIISKELPDGVFLGGDLLPNDYSLTSSMEDFIQDFIFKPIRILKKRNKITPRFFIIFGNDDPRIYEELFLRAEQNALLDYVHLKTISFLEYYVSGYSYIPPTPFHLKDWERYDVSRHVDIGAIPPEQGRRTIDVPIDTILSSTISDDLKNLSKNAPENKTIFLFHSPPYNSFLDRAALDGKMIDYAPLDSHIGSIAIQRFINKKQPYLTLHGHAHESSSITGKWKQKFGNTHSFSAAHDGPELALVRFDISNLSTATRELVTID